MNKLAERAGALGLFATANAIADAKIDPAAAPRDARLTERPGADLKRVLGQLARRGHDPELVRALWAMLEGRPLERALVAVDVLAQAIVARNEPLVVELRAAALDLGVARARDGGVGIDLNAHPATRLIASHALRPDLAASATNDLLVLSFEGHLGALGELHRRGDELVEKTATRESLHALARLASLARLPTLASVYLDWLVNGLGYRVATLDLCETLFDAGVPHKLPGNAIQPGDVPDDLVRDTAEYLTLRTQISLDELDDANAALLQSLEKRPRWIGSTSSRLEVIRGHLGTLYGHGSDVTLARVESACANDQLWRYGAKVRAIVAARRQPARALEMFHAYVSSFGHDFDMTITILSIAPEVVKRDIARILVREAFHLPHEPIVWKLLGALHGADSVAAEIDARMRGQRY